MEYLGMQELSNGVTNGSAQQSSHTTPFLPGPGMPVFQMMVSHGHSPHDELNDDIGSKKAYLDRAGEEDSTTPSTSPSRSPSPSPLRSLQRTALDKPLGQLTEEDIMHLTREDCRRYLKEKGMRRPSWNKSQAIQQVLSLKGLFDDKDDEVKIVKPSACPKTVEVESSLVQEAPNPQQSRLMLYSHKMPTAISQPSSSTVNVGYEVGSISSKVPQIHGSDDCMYATHHLNAPQLACSKVAVSSVVDTHSRNFSSYTCPLDHATATPRQLKANSMPSQDAYSQCTQPIGTLGTEPSAQLTIFYSGMVNVYDNVPPDKAQAVMLLAARSNTWKPSLCSQVQSLINIPLGTQNIDASCWPTPHYVHSTLASTEVPLTTVSPSVSTPVSQSFKAIQSEHQPSRKACLQRYLEKRRGRYSLKTPYPASMKGTEGDNSSQLTSERYKFSNLFEMMGPSMGFPYHTNHVQLTPQSSGSETSSPHVPLHSSS